MVLRLAAGNNSNIIQPIKRITRILTVIAIIIAIVTTRIAMVMIGGGAPGTIGIFPTTVDGRNSCTTIRALRSWNFSGITIHWGS